MRALHPHLTKGRWWPVAVPLLCFVLLLLGLVGRSIQLCRGHLGYPLDDTYIHMAMAKHFALNGVWGITAYSFSSSTSSPLYTLLLALCFRLAGIREFLPLGLNILIAGALIALLDYIFRQRQLASRVRLYALTLVVIATPLPILVMAGMEHALHALLTVLFVHGCCRALLKDGMQPWTLALLCLTPLLVMARYEACFLIAIAGLLFAMRRMWGTAVGLALASSLPLILYGWIAWQHGWYPIPNSLLLKANLPNTDTAGMYPGFLASLLRSWSRGIHVALLIGIALTLLIHGYRRNRTLWTYSGIGLLLFAVTATLHLVFARTGWFFRYEAYLVTLGIAVNTIALFEWGLPSPRKLGYVLATACLVALTCRTAYAFYRAPQSVRDIYEQQYQMGLFTRRYLGTQCILLNDIGAVSFLSDARVLDAVGLGNMDPVVARRHGVYSKDWLNAWALKEHAAIAIMYPHLAAPQWNRAASWTIPGNYMSGSDTVGFYVIEPSIKPRLLSDLAGFRLELPRRVVGTYEEYSRNRGSTPRNAQPPITNATTGAIMSKPSVSRNPSAMVASNLP